MKASKFLVLSAALIFSILLLLMLDRIIWNWKDFKSSSSSIYIYIIINAMVLLIAALSAFDRCGTNISDLDVTKDQDMMLLSAIGEAKRSSSQTQVLDTSTSYRVAGDSDDSTDILSHSKEQYICSNEDLMLEYNDSKETPEPERNPDASTELLLSNEMETQGHGNDNIMDMDAIWMAITSAGKPSHERKQPRKSETWETHCSQPSIATAEQLDPDDLLLSAIDWKELRRPNTYNNTVSRRCRGGGLGRDSSSGNDELNQQVEAYIKRFKEDMLIQRKESHLKLLDMFKRGM